MASYGMNVVLHIFCIFAGHVLQNIYGQTNEDLEADS